MTLTEIKSNIMHILGLETDDDNNVLTISKPLPIELQTTKENVYVIATFPPYYRIQGEVRFEYERPHYSTEYVTLEICYDDENQTIEEIVIPYLEHYFQLKDLASYYQDKRTIKSILNKYSPVMRISIDVEGYPFTLSTNVTFIPKQVDVKYLLNDIVTVKNFETNEEIVTVKERVKDEDKTPLWQQIKTRLDEWLDSISSSQPQEGNQRS